MRGKAIPNAHPTAENRITPAYAGKSMNKQKPDIRQQDHPRLCGEKRKRLASRQLDAGSPPPMRGKGYRRGSADPVLGITPAYAGKSCVSYEYGFKIRGSPPPMRGKVFGCLWLGKTRRITPAYAGKSHSLFHSPEMEQDHPRLCGEKLGVRACIQA